MTQTLTDTAQQLYPLSRLAGMDDKALKMTLSFALADGAETSHVVYHGMTRHTTVLTARRTVADVTAHINLRTALKLDRQATLDVLHGDALAAGPVE